MPHGHDRARPGYSGENDALVFALLADAAAGEVQLAQARLEPITVPRPQAWDTVTVGVITGRPLKLEFSVNDVKTREVVRDDLVLGFEDGGKIVLKDYMHAFGMLGEQRTTIIQPDGKHYAFTELLSPTAGPRAETPAPGTRADVVIIQKPPAGETQNFKLSPDKPMALNFGMGEVARSEVKDGNLILTFKDKGVLVLEGYTALKDSADIALYFAKGDKISLADLAPGAGPDAGAEGGHLFSEFAPGGSLGPLAHLGPLGPEPFDLIPPPGPPGSPPPTTPPPEFPPPPPPPVDCKPPPPQDCEPPPKDCVPPPVKDCDPPPKDCDPTPCEPKIVICDPDPKDCAPDPKDGGKDHGKLTWVVASGCEIGGDARWPGGRWGEHDGRHDRHERMHADADQRGWTNGHDEGGVHHAHHPRGWHADHDARGDWAHEAGDGTYGARHDHGWDHAAPHGKDAPDAGWPSDGWSSDAGHWSGAHQSAHRDGGHDSSNGHDGGRGHDAQHASVSSHDVFDTGAAPAHAGHGHHAAAHDIGAVAAHTENHAPQIQNHAQHNVMGHG